MVLFPEVNKSNYTVKVKPGTMFSCFDLFSKKVLVLSKILFDRFLLFYAFNFYLKRTLSVLMPVSVSKVLVVKVI